MATKNLANLIAGATAGTKKKVQTTSKQKTSTTNGKLGGGSGAGGGSNKIVGGSGAGGGASTSGGNSGAGGGGSNKRPASGKIGGTVTSSSKKPANTPLSGVNTAAAAVSGANSSSGSSNPYLIRRAREVQQQNVDINKYNTAGEFKAPDWSDAYRQGIDTSYYSNAINAFKGQAEKNRQNQLGAAKDIQDSALKQAYIQRAQNDRAMAENLAQAGVRGGASESAMLGVANQYGQARNAANTDYSNSVNAINQAIDQNIFDYQSDMESRAEEYLQNMANARWQNDVQSYTNNYNNQNEWNMNAYNTAVNQASEKYQADLANEQNFTDAWNQRQITGYEQKLEDRRREEDRQYQTSEREASQAFDWKMQQDAQAHDNYTLKLTHQLDNEAQVQAWIHDGNMQAAQAALDAVNERLSVLMQNPTKNKKEIEKLREQQQKAIDAIGKISYGSKGKSSSSSKKSSGNKKKSSGSKKSSSKKK